MIYDEAVVAAQQGKKIRRQVWNDESFAGWNHGRVEAKIGNKRWCEVSDLDTVCNDWEIIEE